MGVGEGDGGGREREISERGGGEVGLREGEGEKIGG